MRVWLASLLFLAVAADSAVAEVPAGSLDLTLKTPRDEEDGDSTTETDFIAPTEEDTPRQFNMARCLCDEGGDTQNVLFEPAWVTGMRPTDPSGTKLFAWAGSDCDNAPTVADREMSCSRLTGIADATSIDGNVNLFVGVGDLLTPGTTAGTMCLEDRTSVTYGLYTSDDAEATIDEVAAVAIEVDMLAPPMPDLVTVAAQEGQIAVSWESVEGDGADIKYFQALCSRADGAKAHDTATHERQYDTPFTLCGAQGAVTLAQLDVANQGDFTTPVAEDDLSSDLLNLNEAYVCGQSNGGSGAGTIELKGLKSEVPYEVVLLAVDRAGNVRGGFVPYVVTPVPVDDFWEDVNQEPGNEIEGGLCLIESTFGAGGGGGGLYGALRAWRDELSESAAGRWMVARYYDWGAPLAHAAQQSVVARVVLAAVLLPLIAVALAWHLLGLPLLLALLAGAILLRRMRRRRTARARLRLAVAAAVFLTPALAAAQSSMTPYWDDAAADDDDAVDEPTWHVGLRIGPFLPGIDDERLPTMPYQRMYGDGTWMPSLDVHRVWTTRAGQVGAGLSLGYFGKTGDAWVEDSNTIHAENNPTKLRIIPTELTAIYRASQLDDNWGIPFVPYLRGGLAYSLWWVRRPDGELSKSCEVPGEQCDRGIGGSLGLVGAVGLSIRAERIDGDAARSMRDSGLDHAGFYAEYTASWVDGFGNAKKLSLGDTTWSAGVDFEF